MKNKRFYLAVLGGERTHSYTPQMINSWSAISKLFAIDFISSVERRKETMTCGTIRSINSNFYSFLLKIRLIQSCLGNQKKSVQFHLFCIFIILCHFKYFLNAIGKISWDNKLQINYLNLCGNFSLPFEWSHSMPLCSARV